MRMRPSSSVVSNSGFSLLSRPVDAASLLAPALFRAYALSTSHKIMSDLTPSGIPPIPEPSPYQPPSGSLIPPGSGSDLILTPNDKNMGMLCHLLALSGLIIPFGHVIGPLIIWLMQKDKSAFADLSRKGIGQFPDQRDHRFFVLLAAHFAIRAWIPLDAGGWSLLAGDDHCRGAEGQ